jgi:hypothetical protein
MKYGIQTPATPIPVELIESKEGITFVTSFTELIPYTFSALLQGFGCSPDMIKRIEYNSSIFNYKVPVIHMFTTSNIHTFAACCTNGMKSLRHETGEDYVDQIEIIELIESFEGSFENSGTYVNIGKIIPGEGKKIVSLEYSPPIFETALRYLIFLKQTFNFEGIYKEKYMFVLYVPEEKRDKEIFAGLQAM